MLAEFVNLHVYILSGKKDLLFNLLQCFSMLTNIWLIFEISRKIGCRKIYAYLAAFLFFTSPSAFGEALTTQADQFATLWLLIFVYYFLDLVSFEYKFSYERETKEKCLCICWGYLAKPSVLVGVMVLTIALLWRCIKRKDSAVVIARLLLYVIPCMFLILLPELCRNFISFGGFSLPVAGTRQLIGTVNPLYALVNGLKNLTFNLPNIYMYQSNHWIAAVVYRISNIFKVAIDNPTIAEDGRAFYLHTPRTYEPDMAVNSTIVLLFIICLIWGIYLFRKQKKMNGRNYAILVSIIFLIFCCVVRWEPFVSRYMVAYLALLCPMISFEVEDFRDYFKFKAGRIWPVTILVFMCCVELFGLSIYYIQIAADT